MDVVLSQTGSLVTQTSADVARCAIDKGISKIIFMSVQPDQLNQISEVMNLYATQHGRRTDIISFGKIEMVLPENHTRL